MYLTKLKAHIVNQECVYGNQIKTERSYFYTQKQRKERRVI